MRTLFSPILFCLPFGLSAQLGTQTDRIAVDQFGYRTGDEKIAVISDPQVGYNAADNYAPGATLEVREWGTNTVLFSATPATWNGGQQHDQSGDVVWWFDFSTVTTAGSYYIHDPTKTAVW
ncbi:MAG: hypothetical protein IPK99_09150 [Flavobacteriales bacterium]|nr:hypothetical protein [Flavobacteriales bacterium]